MKDWFLQNLRKELSNLDSRNRRRSLPPLDLISDVNAKIEGKDVLLFCSNSYLGISSDPRLRAAVIDSLALHPFGSGAARLISGNTFRHTGLERKCAQLKSCESSILFSTGYMANIGVMSALTREGDVIFSDALNHASIVDGCRLSRAEIRIFRHRDYVHLEKLLKDNGPRNKGKTVIVTEGVFSMDGDVSNLNEIGRLARRYRSLVVLDDAHGTGILGTGGGGLSEEQGALEVVDIIVGTLGKALGCFGAFVASKKVVSDWLLNMARPFIYTTSLPISVVAAAEAAIDIAVSEGWRREHLQKLSRFVFDEISVWGRGLIHQTRDGSSLHPFTPIVPVVVGEDADALELSKRLQRDNFWVPAVRPPSVAEHSARLRISLSAAHTNEDAERLVEALYRHSRAMGICG